MKINSYHLCFETLSNELRFGIIKELEKEDKSVNELVEKLGVEQSRLSHALGVLKDCNFVDFKQVGKKKVYFLTDSLKKKFSKKNFFEAIEDHAKKFCKECSKVGH